MAEDQSSIGDRVADSVAQFGSSWAFIISFLVTMAIWMGLNSYILIRWHIPAFDPFPYILLNLALSCLAALQAPVIMMSQRRQEEREKARQRARDAADEARSKHTESVVVQAFGVLKDQQKFAAGEHAVQLQQHKELLDAIHELVKPNGPNPS